MWVQEMYQDISLDSDNPKLNLSTNLSQPN